MLLLAFTAGLAVKVPLLFGYYMEQHDVFYVRNASLFVFPLLAVYFGWKRQVDRTTLSRLATAFVLATVFANVYPFAETGHTLLLTVLYLPIALWLAIGIAYTGGRWRQVSGRGDFVRFPGELVIY
ncbi:TPA: hypothetical protein DCE37_04935 [Candidatus Latescibacteria bacterium]|nr:hypothetical protein [Candidatus Latescibacterota bacterium]